MENPENQPIQEVLSQTPVEQPTEVNKPSILSSKWLKIGGVLVVLLILLGGVGIFLLNKSSVTRNSSSSIIQYCGQTHVCSPGYTCGRCMGLIVPGQPTPDPEKMCICIPNSKLTSTPAQEQTATPSPTPTPDPTADWKTFGGEKFGYSFNYPNDWTQNSDSLISMPADPSCPHCAPGPGNIGISYFDNPSSLSLSDYLKANPNSFGGNYYIKDFKPYSVPGIKDAMLDPTSLGAYDVQEQALLNSGKSIVSLYCASSACTNNNTFEKILSTFKFTK